VSTPSQRSDELRSEPNGRVLPGGVYTARILKGAKPSGPRMEIARGAPKGSP
jgi:hypothetical protein